MLVCIVRAGVTFPEAPHPAVRPAAEIHVGPRCHRGPSNAWLGWESGYPAWYLLRSAAFGGLVPAF